MPQDPSEVFHKASVYLTMSVLGIECPRAPGNLAKCKFHTCLPQNLHCDLPTHVVVWYAISCGNGCHIHNIIFIISSVSSLNTRLHSVMILPLDKHQTTHLLSCCISPLLLSCYISPLLLSCEYDSVMNSYCFKKNAPRP